MTSFRKGKNVDVKKDTAQKDTTPTSPPFWKRPWPNRLLWLGLFAGLFLLARPWMQGDVIQGKAPDFSATTLQGETVQLSDYQGQTVLVHFWATWCPICEFEIDAIEQVGQDWPVLKVATQSGTGDALAAYVEKNDMAPTQVLLDPEGTLFQRYGAKAVPASFVINPAGEIAFVEVGYTTQWGLRARLWWADR